MILTISLLVALLLTRLKKHEFIISGFYFLGFPLGLYLEQSYLYKKEIDFEFYFLSSTALVMSSVAFYKHYKSKIFNVDYTVPVILFLGFCSMQTITFYLISVISLYLFFIQKQNMVKKQDLNNHWALYFVLLTIVKLVSDGSLGSFEYSKILLLGILTLGFLHNAFLNRLENLLINLSFILLALTAEISLLSFMIFVWIIINMFLVIKMTPALKENILQRHHAFKLLDNLGSYLELKSSFKPYPLKQEIKHNRISAPVRFTESEDGENIHLITLRFVSYVSITLLVIMWWGH
ncbi:MAG: hypothetical protein CME67_02595 [Halobacteriovoraceae bacterium]|nr:hypothetical protein [Halobacteriovoraceae bacterium]|tara:strand:+ start:18532 stop:19410 length:879 start_codon:yes stop_codon:yes gene_type:complete